MVTEEIARRDWRRRLESFSAVHEGWLVSVEVQAPGLGAQREIVNMPLAGVSIESPDSNAISIAVGFSGDRHLTHTIHDVARVMVELTDEAADAALTMESADGAKAVVRLRTPVRPEIVDGLVRR